MIAFFINPAKQIIFTNVIIVSVVNIRDESPNSIISFVYLMQNFCFETFAVTTNVVSEFGSNNFTLVSMKAKRNSAVLYVYFEITTYANGRNHRLDNWKYPHAAFPRRSFPSFTLAVSRPPPSRLTGFIISSSCLGCFSVEREKSNDDDNGGRQCCSWEKEKKSR
ncbi:hypothetical protein V6N11_020720 [Hibiscus sabdariffa]|uniref:Uncharacterized protein n=1 Tax=Hibiscus sabdariffa TaxID=183260 RepID=A0ABR2Q978_9ROSI